VDPSKLITLKESVFVKQPFSGYLQVHHLELAEIELLQDLNFKEPIIFQKTTMGSS